LAGNVRASKFGPEMRNRKKENGEVNELARDKVGPN
jgi:hypothetical protein